MERISLIKQSRVRPIVLKGVESMGYSLVIRTNCADTPISVYANYDEETVLIYNSGLKRDEMIIVDYRIPAKLKVIIDEYKGFHDPCHREVADVLSRILDGSHQTLHKKEVTFL